MDSNISNKRKCIEESIIPIKKSKISDINDTLNKKRKCEFEEECSSLKKCKMIEKDNLPEPVFVNYNVSIQPLKIKLYDVQLKDHCYLNSDLFLSNCTCIHKHNKELCPIRLNSVCKCSSKNRLFIQNQYLLNHHEAIKQNLRICTNCVHIHEPPCGKCINCNIGIKCIIDESFECSYTTNVLCEHCKQFTKSIKNSDSLKSHFYNIQREELFYLCPKHVHYHKNPIIANKPCYIQSIKCCEEAINIIDLKSSFSVYVNEYDKKYKRYNYKKRIIYNPAIWTEQSTNSFVTWIYSVLYDLNSSKDHLDNLLNAKYTIPEVSVYKSGGDSVIRNEFTGFTSGGFYQTTTMSPSLPEDCVLIPQEIWDKAEKEGYYLHIVFIKRDPSFYTTSMFVCRGIRNPDPTIRTLILPCSLSKPMKQDQDGDKNGIYLLKLCVVKNFDRTKSFLYKICKLEMSMALNNCITLLAEPRYQFSEHNIVFFHRMKEQFMKDEFFSKTFHMGHNAMIEAACGYLRKEYMQFREILIESNKIGYRHVLTIYDYLQQTNNLQMIIDSGAKTNKRLLQVLNDNLTKPTLPLNQKLHGLDGLIPQMNRYIESSKKLSDDGHIQFILLYACEELKISLGILWYNMVCLGDFRKFSNFYCYLFNEASLELSLKDLLEAE